MRILLQEGPYAMCRLLQCNIICGEVIRHATRKFADEDAPALICVRAPATGAH
jgi:hypothetical protein